MKLARIHLKISRQRKDHAVKLARCVITSNDVVVYEDLRIKNLVKNHCLAKSINDAGINILNSGLGTVGHTGTLALDASNALGDSPSTLVGENLPGQGKSLIKESPSL